MIPHGPVPPRDPRPIRVASSPGLVTIVVDPSTARAIADAWEFTHASGGLDYARPLYLYDVAEIRRHAAKADRSPSGQRVDVQFFPAGTGVDCPVAPALRLVDEAGQ